MFAPELDTQPRCNRPSPAGRALVLGLRRGGRALVWAALVLGLAGTGPLSAQQLTSRQGAVLLGPAASQRTGEGIGEAALSAGGPGGPGLALFAAKLLTCADEGPGYLDNGVVLIADGRIQAIGHRDQVSVPAGFEVRDLGPLWLMPGMIDLHSHVGGSSDINGAVFQANPELRVNTAVIPDNESLRLARAAGITTLLFIPGSATNVGGQGVLIKTAGERYEQMLVRSPGSLKVAQADNPKRWGYGMERGMMNWQIREVMRRGVGYAKRWEAFEQGRGPEPRFDLMFEPFRALYRGEAQISAHTQQAQVVLASIQIMRVEAKLPLFIDHGTFDAFKVASIAIREGVPAILGPRNMSSWLPSRGVDHDGRFEGVAAGYQRARHPQIGFNTDAPVIPQEELFLQAGIAARLGFEDRSLETVRGLTLMPARTVGLADRLGSLEVGKEADLVAITGHPADPRSRVERTWIGGRCCYEPTVEGRRF